jgi:phospholipid/cholesterol/gamma-HCH transport system permease protein
VHADEAERLVRNVPAAPGEARTLTVDAAGVTALDTFGAWLLEKLLRGAAEHGREAELVGLPANFRGLVDKVHQVNRQPPRAVAQPGLFADALAALRRSYCALEADAVSFLSMFGAIGAAAIGVVGRPRSFRLTSAVHQLDRVGWRAVGIIVLITFLIGGIIAQQGIFHFRRFGAETFVVDMVGILVLREVGVLIVSIMLAGRSGSAYTAELGSMKMREEMDALRVMGFDPVEVLILPRLIALVIALPLLTVLGSLSALIGGGTVAWVYGGFPPEVFMDRLREAVTIDTLVVGIIKAPFMAAVIGLIACVEGLRVEGSAESLGEHTTASVVKSIFLVIVLDGFFAVFFAAVGI